jgi:hypothetical protein
VRAGRAPRQQPAVAATGCAKSQHSVSRRSILNNRRTA